MGQKALNVVAGIVRRRGRILIARRGAPAELAGMWEFPGGKIRKGETPEAALRREWREEFGIVVTPLRRLGATLHRGKKGAVRLVFVEARTAGTPRFLEAHDATAWVFPRSLGRYRFAPADRAMAQRVARRNRLEPLPPAAVRRRMKPVREQGSQRGRQSPVSNRACSRGNHAQVPLRADVNESNGFVNNPD